MYFYNFHIADFNAATRHLTHLERAFYRDLIDMYYDTEKAITGDLPKLERLLLVKTDDEKQALQSVLDEFFVIKTDEHGKSHYHNKRIDRELGIGERMPWHKWKYVRMRVFQRDNFTCVYCGVKNAQLECDHILPISKGGSDDIDNLATACKSCNCSKNNKLLEDWLK